MLKFYERGKLGREGNPIMGALRRLLEELCVVLLDTLVLVPLVGRRVFLEGARI